MADRDDMDNEELKQELEDVERELMVRKTFCDDVEVLNGQMIAELESLKAQLAALKANLSSAVSSETVIELERTIETLKAQLLERDNTIEQLRLELARLREELAGERAENTRFREEASTFQQREARLLAENEQLRALTSAGLANGHGAHTATAPGVVSHFGSTRPPAPSSHSSTHISGVSGGLAVGNGHSENRASPAAEVTFSAARDLPPTTPVVTADHFEDLQRENQALVEELQALREDLTSDASDVQRLAHENGSLRQDMVDILHDELAKIAVVTSANEKLRTENNALAQDVEELKSELLRMAAQQQQLLEENSGLRTELGLPEPPHRVSPRHSLATYSPLSSPQQHLGVRDFVKQLTAQVHLPPATPVVLQK
eukprot:TRINITY_DN1110_c0_g1_i2.p1 TRINITY_DN1110_c0_g1~~TRINITY_DN1110_c0_g1_i2.p1  ORF type:complete len:375 (-),score=85.54 TRINITY_DN1110_c0_g1_i2:28-1152(-)